MPVPARPAQLWMAATCAILTTLTRRAPRHDLLGGTEKSPESTATTRTILANSWDVQNAESLRSTLAWLRDVGHRAGHTPSPTDGLRSPPRHRLYRKTGRPDPPGIANGMSIAPNRPALWAKTQVRDDPTQLYGMPE